MLVTILAHASVQASILSLLEGLFMSPLTLPEGREGEVLEMHKDLSVLRQWNLPMIDMLGPGILSFLSRNCPIII